MLWIVTELFPPDETSTSYILGEIANAMVQKYNVGVICGPEIYDKRKKIDVEHKFKLDESIVIYRAKGTDIDKNTIMGKTISFVLMSKRIIALVKKYVRPTDKVLMVTNPAPMIPLIARLKKKVGFELNILVHDVFPENTRPAGLRLPLFNMIKHIFDKAYSCANRIITLGRDMADVMKQKVLSVPNGSAMPDIIIIENWADTDSITPQPFPEGKIIIEYAGNIGRVQGLDKVMDRLPDDIEFHLYGTGAMEKTLKARKQKNLFFHGPYFRSQQNEVLAACNISLVTLQDGMYGLGVPSKTYNIMAAGRPILFIGPKNSEIDLLVREKKLGYCEWPKHWDRSALSDMGKNARRIAVQEYSKAIILNKFLKAL
ncbi:MAG TPA: glycosyltransferase family 4 protein [Candidatus Coprenecus pullistercoris]|nr:glycosyltransferase family 4 protein [Candidatus Coprenecus pullistercoris]